MERVIEGTEGVTQEQLKATVMVSLAELIRDSKLLDLLHIIWKVRYTSFLRDLEAERKAKREAAG